MPDAEAIPLSYTRNPNWLLRGVVIFSIGVHALALGHMARVYKTEPVSVIELEINAQETSSGRMIPIPPQRQKTAPQPVPRAYPTVCSVPLIKPVKPVLPPRPEAAVPSAVEPIAVPQPPDVSTAAPLDWQPVATAASTSVRGSSSDYLAMVRMMIEKQKQYPYSARKRRIQGRAVVRFVISADGSVTDVALVKSSRYGMLDTAALAAVRDAGPFPVPPQDLFSGPIPLEIGVAFELM